MSSRAHTGPWSPLDASLRAYYQGPGTQSNSNANPQPAPRPQSARRPQPARQNPQPGASSYSCNRFERFENRPVTRSWAKKLSELEDQTEVLLLLQFKKGNEAIDAFNRQCRRLGLYRKTDDMSSLERAAVDSAMVRGWEEFLGQWEEAGRLQAEEELRRQRQQQQQQRAAQRRAERPQPRRQKTPVGPRNKIPETNPSASSPPGGQSSSNQANAGPSAPGGQTQRSPSPPSARSSNKQGHAGQPAQQGPTQHPANPSPPQGKPTYTGKAVSSAQQAQRHHPASQPTTPNSNKQTQANPTQTAPLTQLQKLQRQLLDAQKDLDDKRRAHRTAIQPPIRHRASFIMQLFQAQLDAEQKLSSAKFRVDIEKRKAAAMAMPGSFLDNLENPGAVSTSQREVPEMAQSQESSANPKPAPAKPAPAKPAPAKPAPAKSAPAKLTPTAPLTDLQRCRQRVVDAQKDLAEKTQAFRSAKLPPITVSQDVMTELSDAHMWAQHEMSQAQFAEDSARRRAAAAAMPGDFADSYAALSSVAKSEWVIPDEVAAGKTVTTGPTSDPQELHQRVVDAQENLDDCKREYQETVKPPNRPPLAVVNQLRLACVRAQDELANVLMDKENGRRARVAEPNNTKAAEEEEEATGAKVARQRQREESRPTEQSTPQTQSSTAKTTPAAPKTSPTTGPSFLAKLKADHEAARLASAELQKKREAEAAANPTTQKRRRPLEGDLFLNLMKQKQKGKGPEDKKATVEEVPDSAREEKIGKGKEREGADLRERIGPSPTVPKVDEEDLYSGA